MSSVASLGAKSGPGAGESTSTTNNKPDSLPDKNDLNQKIQIKQITLQSLQALPGLQPGAQGHHLLVKTENGQYQLLRVGSVGGTPTVGSPASNSIVSLGGGGGSTSTSNSSMIAVAASAASVSPFPSLATSSGIRTMNTARVVSASSPLISSSSTSSNPSSPLTYRLQTVPTSNSVTGSIAMASMSMQPHQVSPISTPAQVNSSSVSQMTAETAKMKCKNFLSFLLELSAKQNQQVARNVKSLIQGLVDGKVNAEDFSDKLQKEVNSQPQPCLVGFLKKSLPHLRQALALKELTIEGIRPPALSTIVPAAPISALVPNQVRTPGLQGTPVRIISPITNSNSAPIPRSTAAAVQQRFATTSPSLLSPNVSTPPSTPSPQPTAKSKGSPTIKGKGSSTPGKGKTSSSPSFIKSVSSSGKTMKDKGKVFSSSSTYGGDDDINDVAAMGGVNLAEESQRILGSTEFVGTQIRSCGDRAFLSVLPLQSKIKSIAARHGLEEPTPEIAALVSHATEERVKSILEKLSVIAEHRLDVIKMDDRYVIDQDVKGQLKFMEELDKLERKRHDEQEREMLIRAAKSRSKSEDPEQAKLKAKAKEMQRVAMEEMRQREANLTALQAIGPRKKPRLDNSFSSTPPGSQSSSNSGLGSSFGASNRSQMSLRPRLKRVTLRDLLFLMETEKETNRSQFLYKHLLLK